MKTSAQPKATMDVILNVSVETFGTVAALLKDTPGCDIIDFRMSRGRAVIAYPKEPTAAPAPAPVAEQVSSAGPANGGKSFAYAGGKHHKGISSENYVLQVMQGGPSDRIWSLAEMQTAFKNRQPVAFVGKSCSPALSALMKQGKIVRVGRGRYCLPGTTIALRAVGANGSHASA